ncbi:dTDP-4-dehydrorhamnose 3,5-epimerase family protein [Mesorhizobium sp. ArgA1]
MGTRFRTGRPGLPTHLVSPCGDRLACHAETIDRLFCCVGSVRISLFDGRKASPTFGAVWHKILGPLRPAVVIIPPGIWHGIVSLGAETAVVLNLVDKAYAYDQPDHWRLPPDTDHIPYKLV